MELYKTSLFVNFITSLSNSNRFLTSKRWPNFHLFGWTIPLKSNVHFEENCSFKKENQINFTLTLKGVKQLISINKAHSLDMTCSCVTREDQPVQCISERGSRGLFQHDDEDFGAVKKRFFPPKKLKHISVELTMAFSVAVLRVKVNIYLLRQTERALGSTSPPHHHHHHHPVNKQTLLYNNVVAKTARQ